MGVAIVDQGLDIHGGEVDDGVAVPVETVRRSVERIRIY